ncbi:hypothetical protein LCGC14_0381960 [marine sediment metagenome]|uniref:Uncharacterized protein n=1 Tax=marine sediment metagenome TaxID=412755 RepID=A0A0F9T854_9ZZZZ
MLPEELVPGDIVIFTSRDRKGTERRGAIITSAREDGTFNYKGWSVGQGLMPTGQGLFNPETVGNHFGFTVDVEKVGYIAPKSFGSTSSLFRNPGFDLMHDPPRRSRDPGATTIHPDQNIPGIGR